VRHLQVFLFAYVVTGCGTDATPVNDDPFPPPKDGEGIQIAMSVMTPPGTEVWKCRVLDLPFDRFTNVNRVESVQNDGTHHMDLTAIALAAPDLEPGDYDCNDIYAQYPALMDSGIIVYAAQQAEQHIQLPEGVAAQLLPHMRMMHEIHFVNPTEETVEAYSKINAYIYDDAKVTQNIWGGVVRDQDINVPAGAHDFVEWTRCTMNADVDVMFLATHTHALATKTEIRTFDGTSAVAGEVIYTNTDWHAPQLHDYTAAPLHIPAGKGFEFSCYYTNPTGMPVHWGFSAKEEMCQIALVYTPGETTRTCETVASGTR
jgi:hypothetical protein